MTIEAPPAVPVTGETRVHGMTRADVLAVAKATYALGDHLHSWEDASVYLQTTYVIAICEALGFESSADVPAAEAAS